jgi:hypothetical protein
MNFYQYTSNYDSYYSNNQHCNSNINKNDVIHRATSQWVSFFCLSLFIIYGPVLTDEKKGA